jgi:hypothetical protein
MGAAVAEGEQSRVRGGAAPPAPTAPAAPVPLPFQLDGLLLLDAAGNDPVTIDRLIFDDDGVGVIRHHGESPRVLPWSSMTTHVVEPWAGGFIPEWWVDPELNRSDPPAVRAGVVTDPDATSRSLPHAEPGALIGIQTATGTYRFLLPGGDPTELSGRVAALAVSHQGPAGASSVTTVVGSDRRSRRGRGSPTGESASAWSKVQPYLVVALVVFIGAAVTLILLQSAGAIHLPFLGGANPGSLGPLRTR